MACFVNIHEAKSTLSRLVQRVEAGEEIVIARAGHPVVRLVSYAGTETEPRQLGTMKGKIRIRPSFYEPLPAEILDLFDGRGQ